MKNLINEITETSLIKAIKDFGISLIIIDTYGELNIISDFDVPFDYVESFEKLLIIK